MFITDFRCVLWHAGDGGAAAACPVCSAAQAMLQRRICFSKSVKDAKPQGRHSPKMSRESSDRSGYPPEISCKEISFSINPLKDQSATSFTIKNPHLRPLCVHVSQSASARVMSVSAGPHSWFILQAGESTMCSAVLLHAGNTP